MKFKQNLVILCFLCFYDCYDCYGQREEQFLNGNWVNLLNLSAADNPLSKIHQNIETNEIIVEKNETSLQNQTINDNNETSSETSIPFYEVLISNNGTTLLKNERTLHKNQMIASRDPSLFQKNETNLQTNQTSLMKSVVKNESQLQKNVTIIMKKLTSLLENDDKIIDKHIFKGIIRTTFPVSSTTLAPIYENIVRKDHLIGPLNETTIEINETISTISDKTSFPENETILASNETILSLNETFISKNKTTVPTTEIIAENNATIVPMIETTVTKMTTIEKNESIVPIITTTTSKTLTKNLKEVITTLKSTPLMTTTRNDLNLTTEDTNQTLTEEITTKPEYVFVNESKPNVSKTMEELFEEENRLFNRSRADFENSTILYELGQLNTSMATEIIAAMPGIPIFLEPPEIKIHDPDEGPLDPYHHPSNESQVDDYPSTLTPNQQFIYMNKPDFEPEKGSLEEKYKHLLVDTKDDDIPLPSDLDMILNSTETTPTLSEKTAQSLNDSTLELPLPPPMMPFQYPYGYPFPYGYNPYFMAYPPYWPPYYGQGYRMPYMPPMYPGYPMSPTTDEEEVEVKTQTELNKLNKMLPKSYPEFGAYVANVAIDEKQSKELGTGDADTLEMLGPLELAITTTAAPTTTTLTTTPAKEIRFFINTQNNNKLLKDHKNDNSSNGSKNVKTGQKEDQKSSTPSIDSSLVDMKSLYSISKDLNQHNPKKVIRKKVYRIRNRTKMPTILDISHKQFTERTEYREKTVTTERPFTEETVRTEGPFSGNFTIIDKKYKVVDHSDHNDHGQIKTNKSQHRPQIVWKHRSKPKFLIRAKIKALNKMKADEVTGIKWWYLTQPEYCRISIYVVKDCAQPNLQKRWSFNSRDNRCYQYEDSCPQYKANSFKSSNDCFRKCYRIKEKV